MPSRPPETEFYDHYENAKLWRDVSRLWEDWAPMDAPDRSDRFITVLQEIIEGVKEVEVAVPYTAASSNG